MKTELADFDTYANFPHLHHSCSTFFTNQATSGVPRTFTDSGILGKGGTCYLSLWCVGRVAHYKNLGLSNPDDSSVSSFNIVWQELALQRVSVKGSAALKELIAQMYNRIHTIPFPPQRKQLRPGAQAHQPQASLRSTRLHQNPLPLVCRSCFIVM